MQELNINPQLNSLLTKLRKFELPSKHCARSRSQIQIRNHIIRQIKALPIYSTVFRPEFIIYPDYAICGVLTRNYIQHLTIPERKEYMYLLLSERKQLLDHQLKVSLLYDSSYLRLSIGANIGHITQKINLLNINMNI